MTQISWFCRTLCEITAEDLRSIWRAALDSNKRDFAMITLMATTDIRAGELVSMALPHRGARAWLDNGINAEIVSQALGHADVTTTLMIYGNQDDRRVSQAVREAEMALFSDPSGPDDLEWKM